MNHAAVAPLCRPAAQEIEQYAKEAAKHAYLADDWYERIERGREVVARLLGATAQEISFVKNTSEGLGMVANGINWRDGDNVVITSIEFPANRYPWQTLAAKGVALRTVEPTATGEIPVEKLINACDRRTRVLSISHVQYATGYRCDLNTLGANCRDRGIYLCVDAIQSLGVIPIDVHAANVDFLAADGHKWLCGPEGAGVFFCRKALLDSLQVSSTGWKNVINATHFGSYDLSYRPDAGRFESGSFNIPGILALIAAVSMWNRLGIDRVWQHVWQLTDRLVDGLSDQGYSVAAPRDSHCASGIVAFPAPAAGRLQRELRRKYRIIVALREGRIRISPHAHNRIDQIDELLEAINALGT